MASVPFHTEQPQPAWQLDWSGSAVEDLETCAWHAVCSHQDDHSVKTQNGANDWQRAPLIGTERAKCC